ncbi:MAG TPA: pyridoxamine 5'-phosphate oxidase family protein [Pseudonocardiaceae bacterium]|nr:pyridoxamine 5'-phosphate oxidase family protein [Pseudonocardiaceae bacterium]
MLEVTARTKVTRLPYRQVTDRQVLYEVLDAGLVAHVALCDGGLPVVLPVGYARDDDRLLIHGSTGGGLLRKAAAGAPVAVGVTLLDGLVYARSLFDSSMNYRSVVVFGQASPVRDEAKPRALRLLAERLMPGRWDEVREPNGKELAATLVLELPLAEASVKIRTGPPSEEDPPEPALPGRPRAWAGVLPLHTVTGSPVPAPDVEAGTAEPESLQVARRRIAELNP